MKNKFVKVEILKDCPGSNDGINVKEFKKGDICEISESLFYSFGTIGAAKAFMEKQKETPDALKEVSFNIDKPEETDNEKPVTEKKEPEKTEKMKKEKLENKMLEPKHENKSVPKRRVKKNNKGEK
jgi:hypothetical protein